MREKQRKDPLLTTRGRERSLHEELIRHEKSGVRRGEGEAPSDRDAAPDIATPHEGCEELLKAGIGHLQSTGGGVLIRLLQRRTE